MKLDATDLRYITSEEFRVLTAVEMGSKNHEVVPLNLIVQISGIRGGGVNKLIGSLAKRNLISKVQNSKYEGYRLTYGGYDYLAIKAMLKRGSLSSVGNQIGVGKESDIHIVANDDGEEMVLKIHRLGRTSFRSIKQNRDYMGKRKSASWMYLSRLSAQKEWAFMKVLHEHGFPIPKPIDQARHCVLMEFIDAYPLRQIADVPSPGKLYSTLMDMIVRFAQAGLIHGDFNEFNILIREGSGEPVVIDFPQMVSTSHANAEWYFNRDVECIRTFFRRRFRYESAMYPKFKRTMAEATPDGADFRLDVVVEASGFKKEDMKALDEYMEAAALGGQDEGEGSQEEDEDEEDEDEEDEDEEDEDEEDEDEEDGEESEEEADQADQAAASTTIAQTLSSEPIESQGASAKEPDIPQPSDLDLSKLEISEKPQDVNEEVESSEEEEPRMKTKAVAEANKKANQQRRKYHSKKSARNAGRPQGSKAKQDTRVKLDNFWT